jgi:hypothetical protein
MPPMEDRIADTAAWPCRNSIRYIVICPSEIRVPMAATAIHA